MGVIATLSTDRPHWDPWGLVLISYDAREVRCSVAMHE